MTAEPAIQGERAALQGVEAHVPEAASVRRLYVVGGQQRGLRPMRAHFRGHWYEYQKAVAAELDIATGAATQRAEWVTPESARPDVNPAILFKSGTRVGDRLYVTSQTEVFVYKLPSFQLETYLSLPFFNDVHHVRPTPDGTLLIAVTGLDMVAEVTTAGELVRAWNVHEPGASVWGGRFSPEVDYRRVTTTKPHLAHPNHVFYLGNEPWVTRFEQRDAMSLDDSSRRIEIGVERLHDGIVHGDNVYFTAVDGKVVIADTKTLTVTEIIDLTTMHPPDTLLGWCRGLMLDGDRMYVGFTTIRPTRFHENVSWLKNGFRRYLGTHVAVYDLRERRCVAQLDTEVAGVNAVFGIYAADDEGGFEGSPT